MQKGMWKAGLMLLSRTDFYLEGDLANYWHFKFSLQGDIAQRERETNLRILGQDFSRSSCRFLFELNCTVRTTHYPSKRMKIQQGV